MESVAYILLTGILIGILISAPMGPIGMLVIQRTLNKGRTAAFFTGVGASLSDIVYCLLTGLGLSFVTDFIESNQNLLQVIGSLVLIIYAVYLFKNNPSRSLKPPVESATNYWRDFVTGFLFTFSNPLILFFIIGLFARFNFLDTHYRFYHYIKQTSYITGYRIYQHYCRSRRLVVSYNFFCKQSAGTLQCQVFVACQPVDSRNTSYYVDCRICAWH